MPDVYAQTFQLSQRGGTTLLMAVSETLRSWLRERWPPGEEWFSTERFGTVLLDEGTTLIWEPWSHGERAFLDFTMRQPSSGTSAYEWRTRLTFLGEGTEGVLQLRIENTGPEFGYPGAELTMRPKLALLIHLFCDATCDGRMVEQRAELISGDDVLGFIHTALLDAHRKSPIVVLSRPSTGPFVIQPEKLATWLATCAQVVAVSQADTWTLTKILGRPLSVFGGALRIYQPGLSISSDPVRHPLIVRHRLALPDEQLRVAKWLALLTTRRFRDDPRRLAWRDQMQLAESKQRLARENELQLALSRAADSQDAHELSSLIDKENHELRQTLASRDALVSSLEERVRSQDDTLRRLRYALEQRGLNQEELEEVTSPAVPDLEPDSVFGAVLTAQEQYLPLLFLDSALESAEESDFQRPEEVLEALRRLAEIAKRAASRGGLKQSLPSACKASGLDYGKGLPKHTPPKIQQKYVFTDGSRDYRCVEHLRLGGGGDSKTNARIYFSSERLREGILVIGHVGRHLEVMSSN